MNNTSFVAECFYSGRLFVPPPKVANSFCHAVTVEELDETKKWIIESFLYYSLFLALTEFKIVYAALWVMTYISLYSPFPTDATSQAYTHTIALSMANTQTSSMLLCHHLCS